MLALLGGISGRYLLVDIQEEMGADGGAFPDGMDWYFNDITYKHIFYNKLFTNLNSNLSILIRLPFGPDEVENIVEVSKVIRAIRLR